MSYLPSYVTNVSHVTHISPHLPHLCEALLQKRLRRLFKITTANRALFQKRPVYRPMSRMCHTSHIHTSLLTLFVWSTVCKRDCIYVYIKELHVWIEALHSSHCNTHCNTHTDLPHLCEALLQKRLARLCKITTANRALFQVFSKEPYLSSLLCKKALFLQRKRDLFISSFVKEPC